MNTICRIAFYQIINFLSIIERKCFKIINSIQDFSIPYNSTTRQAVLSMRFAPVGSKDSRLSMKRDA